MNMKHLNIIIRIMLHPFKSVYYAYTREYRMYTIRKGVKASWWEKNHERMHAMSTITKTSYCKSDLLDDLYKGAL